MSSESRSLRNWRDILLEGNVVHSMSDWSQWAGVQLIHMAHRMRRFEIHSDYHAILVYVGQPAPYELTGESHPLRGVMEDGAVSFFAAHSRYMAECNGDINEDIGLKIDPERLIRFAHNEELVVGTVAFGDVVGRPDPSLASLFHLLREDVERGHPNGKIYGDSLVAAVSAHLVRAYATVVTAPSSSNHHLERARIVRIREYVQANLSADLSLAEIAEQVGYSPYHLHRMFRRATGLRLHEYVNEARLDRARHLLRGTQWTVSAIAAEVGYADQSHLARQFRRRYGVSPGEYRLRER